MKYIRTISLRNRNIYSLNKKISKTDYINFLKCPNYVWYYYHKKDEIPQQDDFILNQGILFGEKATELYKNGILINSHYNKGSYDTKLILAGRHLNDEMTNLMFSIIKKDISLKDRILQIGVTFKENVPDIRNSKAAELANFFTNSGYNLDLYDPVAQKEEVLKTYGLKLTIPVGRYDYIILAVPHEPLVKDFNREISKYYKNTSIIFDVKGVLKNKSLKKNIIYKSL